MDGISEPVKEIRGLFSPSMAAACNDFHHQVIGLINKCLNPIYKSQM